MAVSLSTHPESARLFARARHSIPGGCVSLNRRVDPEIVFVRGQGSRLWDADGNAYIDYHAAFGPYLLGHNHPEVEAAVQRAQRDGWTLTGTGTTPWEIEAAETFLQCVPSMDTVQFTNTGSEATYLALRLARAATGRDHIAVMQGGYNGWHDEVACNVMTPLDALGPQREDGEYPFVPMSAGMPSHVRERVHVLEFNSLAAVEWAFRTYPIAALITEPILQNIGVIRPDPGYLAGLRRLCDQYGVVLILDEVKTGFRHGLGGYQAIAGVQPDLAVFGKAIANGYPVGALAGRRDLMGLFDDPNPARRVLIAGTYNGHPIPLAAAIATMQLLRDHPEWYARLEALTAELCEGIAQIMATRGIKAQVVRQGSAFCPYRMDHAPRSWHDLATHHQMDWDTRFRRAAIAEGVYTFPLPTKQWSVSTAHSREDVEQTLEALDRALERTPA